MSSRSLCTAAGCANRSFADSQFCLSHAPNALELQQFYVKQIVGESLLRDLVLPAISLDGIDFSNKTLMNCDFHAAKLRNCTFNATKMTFCLFDHATFEQVTVAESKIIESIFACSHFIGSEFATSDIIQCNFNGCWLGSSVFVGNDLMYSRFMALGDSGLSFEDCNLKAVHFSARDANGIGFKFSNKEDAFFL